MYLVWPQEVVRLNALSAFHFPSINVSLTSLATLNWTDTNGKQNLTDAHELRRMPQCAWITITGDYYMIINMIVLNSFGLSQTTYGMAVITAWLNMRNHCLPQSRHPHWPSLLPQAVILSFRWRNYMANTRFLVSAKSEIFCKIVQRTNWNINNNKIPLKLLI